MVILSRKQFVRDLDSASSDDESSNQIKEDQSTYRANDRQPPPGLADTALWKRLPAVLPDATLRSDALHVLSEAELQKRNKLKEDIQDLIRTKGGRTHRTVLMSLPVEAVLRQSSIPRSSSPSSASPAQGLLSPRAPEGAGSVVAHGGRPMRFIALTTVPILEPIFGTAAKIPGRGDLTAFAPFRFSFMTLFFVGLACGKFKRLLRRKTRAEQAARYENLLKKAISQRKQVISTNEANNYTPATVRNLVDRTRKDATINLTKLLDASNAQTRMMRLNPRRSLATLEQKKHSDSPAASPRASQRAELGEFLRGHSAAHSIDVDDSTQGEPISPTSALITLVPGVLGGARRRNTSGGDSAGTAEGGSPALPSKAITFGGDAGDEPAIDGITPVAGKRPDHVHMSFSLANLASSSSCRGGAGSSIKVHQASLEGTFSGAGSPAGGVVRRGSSRHLPAFASAPSSPRHVPLFEQVSDKNIFVLGAHWEDMQYIPLKERSKKSIAYQSQVEPSKLLGFTQSILPASTKPIQSSFGDTTKKDVGQDHGSPLQHTASETGFIPSKPVDEKSAAHVAKLRKANIDIKSSALVSLMSANDRKHPTVDIGQPIRATRAIAKPLATSFNFYEWRTRQNKALFHHLCLEQREIANALPPADPFAVFEGNGEDPLQASCKVKGTQGDSAAVKELEALRERVRRRAQDVEFDVSDSASTTFDKFMVHKELEHVRFLQKSMVELDRLLETKSLLSSEAKQKKLSEKVESNAVLVERFVLECERLNDELRQQLEDTTIAENEMYNMQWILTCQHRTSAAFGNSFPPECRRVFELALATAKRCSYRDLTFADLEAGVINELDPAELLSPSCQFVIERLLPAFLSLEAKCAVDARKTLRTLYEKRHIPYFLLTEEDEADIKHQSALSEADREKRIGAKTVHSIERLNNIMEPLFDRFALAALNELEARHVRMRQDLRRMRDMLAKSEEDALERAANLQRRTSRSFSLSGAASFLGGKSGATTPRKKSVTLFAAPQVGVDSISAERNRKASINSAAAESQENGNPPASGDVSCQPADLPTPTAAHHAAASFRGRRQSHVSIVTSTSLIPLPPPSQEGNPFRRPPTEL